MKKSDTALVIGGGVVGVCSAYYLAQRGWEVTLLEQGEICSGSSYGNAGLVVPSHAVPLASPGVLGAGLRWLLDPESPFYIKPRPDPALIRWLWQFQAACRPRRVERVLPLLRDLLCSSLALYEELATVADLEFGYRQDGVLMLFNSQRGYETGLHEAKLLAPHGIAYQVLDAAGVRERVPGVRPEVMGGILHPADAHITPARFVTGLAGVVERMGVRIRPHHEVLDFVTEGNRIARVRTTRGEFSAREVVLASGSWSAGLGKQLGLRVPIQPAKGYSVTVQHPDPGPSLPLNLKEARVAVTPMGDTLRFAGTLELAGMDMTINRRRVDAILKGARRYLDGLEKLELIEIWRGLRPCTPDGLPLLGRARAFDNLTLAAGHAMIGMSLGPITGKLVSQLVAREATGVDLALLDANRF